MRQPIGAPNTIGNTCYSYFAPYSYSTSPPVGKVLTELAALVDAGQVKPRIAAVLPLAEIRQATAMIESGHTAGKIVLEVAR